MVVFTKPVHGCREHFEELSRGRVRDVEQRHKLEFPSWFEKRPDPVNGSEGLFSMASTRSRTRRIEATAPHVCSEGPPDDCPMAQSLVTVEPEMWTKLCNIFADPRYEGKSEINRRNRSKLTVYHTTGTKSFARKRHELLGAVHIDEVGPADLYAASHKRKNGEWICDAARMNFEKMMEVEAQATMEGRTLTDVEVFTQVLGEKRGYVRGLGDSVRPVSTSCSSSSADMARRLTETQLELEQIRADREKESQEQMHEIHSLQQKMEEMQERMARYDRFMSRFASGAFDDVGV
ncbi:hypothetical protein CJ030_MR1G014078 [Morella rubra]|uniref:Transposase, Ptta/En/Spm, plant n=1 Tax=Morella rubra TaxID=262757 RepID=A0A6A1WPI7_9ROSI|nr:hypothetical protein CJ030_MR1G014078 [Morella rubra]